LIREPTGDIDNFIETNPSFTSGTHLTVHLHCSFHLHLTSETTSSGWGLGLQREQKRPGKHTVRPTDRPTDQQVVGKNGVFIGSHEILEELLLYYDYCLTCSITIPGDFSIITPLSLTNPHHYYRSNRYFNDFVPPLYSPWFSHSRVRWLEWMLMVAARRSRNTTQSIKFHINLPSGELHVRMDPICFAGPLSTLLFFHRSDPHANAAAYSHMVMFLVARLLAVRVTTYRAYPRGMYLRIPIAPR
jgi:hypothetical protein